MRQNSTIVTRLRREVGTDLVPWIGLITLVLLTRPFRGIYHDAYLYAAQALRNAEVGDIGQDVIFAYGNQDSFTVFSYLYGPLMQALGLPVANGLLWALALGFWLFALAGLARQLFVDKRLRLLALVGAVVLSPHYGNGVLAYGEGFVTPRPFAEALGLMAITAGLRSKISLGGVLVAIAALLHPLTGIVYAAVFVWFALNSVKSYLALAFGAMALIFGLGAAGLAPFSWGLQAFDQEWLTLLKQQSNLVFLAGWGGKAFGVLALPVVSLGLIVGLGPERLKSIAVGVFAVSSLLVALSVVGADVLGNRLATSLQLWRVLALLTLFGNLLAFTALMVLPASSWAWRLFGLALVLDAIGNLFNLLPVIPGVVAMSAVLALGLEQFERRLWVRVLLGLLVVSVGILALSRVSLLISWVVGFGEMSPNPLGGVRLVLLVLAFAPFAAVARPHHRAVLVLVGVLGAAAVADVRNPWQRYVEGPQPPPDEIRRLVSDRQVYWETGLNLMWFKLNAAQYYSCRQNGGGVFFREQAIEIARRGNILKTLNSADFVTRAGTTCFMKEDTSADGPVSAAQFTYVCSMLPELDLIVLRTALPGMSRYQWELPALDQFDARKLGDNTTFHFYDCDDFRHL